MAKMLKSSTEKKAVAVVLVGLLLCVLCDSTLAYLIAGTDPLVNVFHPAKVSSRLVETTQTDANGAITAKKNVYVENDGEAAIYVRAMIVVKWMNADGSVAAIAPVQGEDYTLELAENTNWKERTDGFWYYTKPVDPGDHTANLLQHCGQTQNTAPKNCYLSIEVLTQAIQATPADAVKDAWGVDPSILNKN